MSSQSEEFGDQIGMKMATTADDQEKERSEEEEEDSELCKPLETQVELEQEHEEEEEEEGEDEEEEFSFVCVDPESSPISADDIFYDGQIRPVYPLFNQALIFGDEDDDNSTSPRPQLRKIFIEHPSSSSKEESGESTVTGTFCEWSGKSPMASPDRCKKSNSTGFSKLWRFRDLLHRSSSDGKDTFVFLHPSTPKKNQEVMMESGENSLTKRDTVVKSSDEASVLKGKAKVKGAKSEKQISAHERHYMRNRVLKEEEKRKSYLPYKVGFFTSANGLSRNLHPF